jgi:hypothetical protein
MRYVSPALLFACLIPTHLEAAEYFVDAQAAGQTTQDGSAARPWSDLSHAVAKLAPQDILSLRPGLYQQRQLTIATHDVWVRKDPAVPGVVVIDGAVPLHELRNQDEHGRQKTRDNGPFFDPVITVTGNGVVLDGLEVRHGFVGISVRGERARILGCHVHHTGQPIDAIERKLERDSYMSAEEARDFGLVDHVVEKRPLPATETTPA